MGCNTSDRWCSNAYNTLEAELDHTADERIKRAKRVSQYYWRRCYCAALASSAARAAWLTSSHLRIVSPARPLEDTQSGGAVSHAGRRDGRGVGLHKQKGGKLPG